MVSPTRAAASALYFNAFFGMGLLLANLGPILPQIEYRTGAGLGASAAMAGCIDRESRTRSSYVQ